MPVCASPRRLSEALVTNLDLLPEPGDDGIRGMKGAQNAPGAGRPPPRYRWRRASVQGGKGTAARWSTVASIRMVKDWRT